MDGEVAGSTATSNPALANLRPWQKGQSGNPSGGSKLKTEFRDKCRHHSDEAIETLLGVMRKEKAMSSAKVQAARVLLAYAWGAVSDQDDTEKSNLIINILKMAIGNGHDPQTIDQPVVVQRLTNGNGADHG